MYMRLYISFAVCGPREMNKAQRKLNWRTWRCSCIKSSAFMSTRQPQNADQICTVTAASCDFSASEASALHMGAPFRQQPGGAISQRYATV